MYFYVAFILCCNCFGWDFGLYLVYHVATDYERCVAALSTNCGGEIDGGQVVRGFAATFLTALVSGRRRSKVSVWDFSSIGLKLKEEDSPLHFHIIPFFL